LSALLLDALGTLLALRPPAPALRAELAGRFGVAVSEAEAEAAIAVEIAYYRAHLDEGRDAAALKGLRRRSAGALRDALPADARERLRDLDALTDALLASLVFEPFPDAVAALPRLREGGRRLVVVSNWDVSLQAVLDRVGLWDSVDAVITSSEAGARKPDVAIFERALRLAGAAASASVHVGDSVVEDVEGALAAGIEPVLLRRDGGPGPAGVRTISSLGELV
jgi:putative hydrolase of the HAD superfamily